MDIAERCDAVSTRADLVAFLSALRHDFDAQPDAWENPTLDRYLGGLEAWTRDMPGYFRNQGLEEAEQPTWNLIAQLLFAASMYE